MPFDTERIMFSGGGSTTALAKQSRLQGSVTVHGFFGLVDSCGCQVAMSGCSRNLAISKSLFSTLLDNGSITSRRPAET